MGSFANALFKIMLGWLQGAISAVWSAFTSPDGTSFLTWIGRNWIWLAGTLCITGLLADLCVYLFRWKPYKVWKSFFFRTTEKEESSGEKEPVYKGTSAGGGFHATEKSNRSAQESRRMQSLQEEPDFSQWETEMPDPDEPAHAEEPPTVTKSGYVVPADSPYRRPAESSVKSEAVKETESETSYAAEKDAGSPVAPRRRRRIRVSELFSDPEEEAQEFDAPQQVIDARRAYHEPVYPHGWQKSEDNEE